MTGAITHHIGFLALDRKKDDDLQRRATILRDRADRGEAILTQRRLGPDQWEYIARVKQ